MAEVSELVQRIRGEFAGSQEKLQQFQTKQVEEHQARRQRASQLEQLFDRLADIWRPRLEALAKEFGDRVKVTPDVIPARRQATLQFQSELAQIRLQFSASADSDVTQLVLAYDLDILPILMQFERHSQISFPLDRVDREAIARWLDDRIVEFVKTYLALYENEYYLKGHMVEDPVAQVRFPDLAAGATRKRKGRTYYFISEETASQFAQQE